MARTATLRDVLQELVDVQGILTSVLVGRDGFVIDGISSGEMDTEAIGAVISTAIGSNEVMGTELEVGDFSQSMVEFAGGVIVTSLVGESAILATVADLQAPLGNVRYQVKKRLPEIERLL